MTEHDGRTINIGVPTSIGGESAERTDGGEKAAVCRTCAAELSADDEHHYDGSLAYPYCGSEAAPATSSTTPPEAP